MKLILAGTSGFVGSKILSMCVRHPEVTSIIVLSRVLLASSLSVEDPKVTVIVLENFLEYPPEVVGQLKAADACIWYVSFLPCDRGHCQQSQQR